MINLLIFLINPTRVYSDFKEEKSNILSDNRSKVGIYILYNNATDSYYVGSSSNIARRMSSYFSLAYLNHPKNKNMIICRSFRNTFFSFFSDFIC